MKSWIAALLAAPLLAALLACGPRAGEPPPAGPPQEASAPAPAPEAARGPTLSYDAVSKTAESFTGALTVETLAGSAAGEPAKIIAARGQTYDLSLVATAAASQDIAGQAWTAILPVPDAARVSVHKVRLETAVPNTPNGGLCAPETTHFLALATFSNTFGAKEMQIAAFSGKTWPPAPDALNLCGSFTYVERAPTP